MSRYGTGDRQHVANSAMRSSNTSSETDTLLPGGHLDSVKSYERSLSARFHSHMSQNITKKHGDVVLLCCYTITGLLDSSATAIWGAFVSMQTGNTVYVGLGLSELPHPSSSRWIKSLTSIVSFCVGSFVFARFHRYFSPRRRWVLTTSFTLQTLMIIGAALMVLLTPNVTRDQPTKPGDGHDLHWHVLVPLAMVAFQSSGQAVASRALQYSGLTSVVLTSNYCDLFSDANLFAGLGSNVERNRRVAAPILLLVGAVLGGLWAKSDIGIAGALWMAAVLKAGMVIAWLTWAREKGDSE